ncbi:MAG TPA: 2-dehydro-3-deoxyglucarate aldolase [Polyangiaceae bacterium]|jgi:2-dehydro-3-deoxyglucarate aldolase|nr:2-dehydro-3-deoxyglucarate aldolase [Polyangiaceae bacterium]
MTAPYIAMPNAFRRDLRANRPLFGCWCSLASNITTEILGYAGFDWLLIDGEHAPNDLSSFITQLQALKDSPSAPVVRPPWAEPVIIKRLLDIGFYNFLMPWIENAEQARAAVAATRYPPAGVRGMGTAHRSNRYGYVPDYFTTVNDNISVMVQIESAAGVANAGNIAAVDGVDGLFIGPSDLSAALGYLGQPNHPEVQQAMARVLAAAREHGKPVGILAPIEADARRYLEQGMTFVAVGGDVGLLRAASKALADQFKKRS